MVTQWQHIATQEFCKYDDYNWDWTLHSLQATCYLQTMKAVVLKVARVYHIGTW